MAVRTVRVIIEASVAGAIANIRAFRGALNQFGNDVDTLATRHNAAFNRMTTQGLRLGIGLAGGFLLAERAAMQFDKQMSAVNAVAGASVGQMAQLRQAALEAGKSTAFTAVEAAKGEEELAKAGVSTADILGGGLKGALNLAAAGSIDLAKAANIAAIAMVQFGLSGRDIGHVADVLTAGANKSATDVQGLGYALGQTGAVAHQLGISLDETVGVLASFAQHGMLGEEAGTALKTMLVKLEAPSAKAKQLMQEYGISLYDAAGNTVSLTTLAGQLRTGLSGLSEEQRNAALATIFGTRAIKAATVLYQEGANGVADWTNKVNDQGAAADTAAKRLDNLAGDLKKLHGALQAAAIESSGGATKGLRFLTQAATGAVHAFADLPTPVSSSITVIAGLTGVALLAASAFLKMRGALAANIAALNDAGWTRTAGALGSIGKWAGRATIIGAAVFGVYEGFKALSDWAASKSAPVARDIDRMTESLGRFAQTGTATGELGKAFGTNLEKLSTDVATARMKIDKARADYFQMESIVSAGGIGTQAGANAAVDVRAQEKAINQAKADLASLDQALANLASSQGGATVAKIAFDRIRDSLMAQGMSASEVTALFGKYNEATAAAAAANGPLAHGFADVATQAKALSQGLQAAVDAGQTLKQVFDELNGAAIGTAQAQIAVTEAVDGLTQAMKANGTSFDLSTMKGAANTKAYIAGAQAARDLAQAVMDQTGSVKAASDAYNTAIGKLDGVARKSGATAAQVANLHSQYAQMPAFVTTEIRALGLDAAIYKIATVTRQIDNLNGRVAYVTTVVNTVTGSSQNIRTTSPNRFQRWGGVYEARSGLLNAGLYGAGARPLYQFAEPETGGEAFIPRIGNTRRSRKIADYVVSNWLGGSTSWGPGGGSSGGGGPATINLDLTLRDSEGHVLAMLRKSVNNRGGNVQAVVSGRSG